MDFFKMTTVEETFMTLKSFRQDINHSTTWVPVDKSLNRITATPIVSHVNIPAFNRSTVDGYAVLARDVQGASDAIPCFLSCAKEVTMGDGQVQPISSGHCVYVPTGGIVPEGADGVVMIEYTEMLDDTTVLIKKPIMMGENKSNIGDDLAVGQEIVASHQVITSYVLGILVGASVERVEVLEPIKVGILSTGDEIIDIGVPQKLGQIRDINGYTLQALLSELHVTVAQKLIIHDDLQHLKGTMAKCLEEVDVLLISGGSSVGTRDYTVEAIKSLPEGQVYVHGVSIKPGKPTIVGKAGNKVIFGLPGHPASAILIYHLFVKPFLEGFVEERVQTVTKAKLTANVHGSPGKATYQMVSVVTEGDVLVANPIYGKSGMISLFTKANGYFCIPDYEEGVYEGQWVEVTWI